MPFETLLVYRLTKLHCSGLALILGTGVGIKMKTLFIKVLLLFCCLPSLHAATHYLDPINGSSSGDGSRALPFGSLEGVVNANLIESQQWQAPFSSPGELSAKNIGAPIKAGDTLILLRGFHGDVDLSRYINDEFITIDGQENSAVKLSSISFEAAAKWRLQGVSISPYHRPGYNPSNNRLGNIVAIADHDYFGPSSEIEVINNDIFTLDDISGWSASNWVDWASSGISVNAERVLIDANQVRNIRFGITVSSNNVVVRRNRVINFSGDGLRGLGDDGLFEYNVVANAFDVDSNHDDGFQSFTNSRNFEPIFRVTLRANQFYYDLDHPNKGLIGAFQGIGCFDGFFNDWVIENNLLYINHWHGITLLGANNAKIFNNTLVDAVPDGRLRPRPWIKIGARKDSLGGGSGAGNITRNNIAWMTNEGSGISQGTNVDPNDHDINDFFVDPANSDFSLLSTPLLVDAGIAEGAPTIDIRGFNRDAIPD